MQSAQAHLKVARHWPSGSAALHRALTHSLMPLPHHYSTLLFICFTYTN